VISVIIPSIDNRFLDKTILDILQKATGKIEIIVVVNGYELIEQINNPRVKYIVTEKGMRTALNAGNAIAQGDYIMKCDEHCLFAPGFDEALTECEDNWVVIPRRKRLDPINWCLTDTDKLDVDYEFLSYPPNLGIKGNIWNERTRERTDPKYDIDDQMSFQGSCYFMSRKHRDWLGPLDPTGYGQFAREAQEVGLKTWLGGGRVVVNKKTWYAHLHKGTTYGRGYRLSKGDKDRGDEYCNRYWFYNEWPERIHNLSWLVKKFAPVPHWPEREEDWTP
jgi:glycosyltransferase involved in cell wall biosynthesis